MVPDLSYPKLLNLFPQHIDPKRTESASFLIWYLENYLRLDTVDAIDAVCDQKGDKGIDGIYLNEDANIIEVYQSKISQSQNISIGDTALKQFEGTLKQLASEASVKKLIASAGTADVAKLLTRLDIAKRIGQFEVRGYFVSNLDLDANGEAYLKHSSIKFIGRSNLVSTFISSSPTARVANPAEFDVSGFDFATYVVDAKHSAVIAPLRATELIGLDGITNQTLYAYNVRGPLGRTQVNRDIAESIRDKSKHKTFPLFHNGITIIAKNLKTTKDKISVENYYVVNGCQSLSELYNNSAYLTDDLRVLVKLIQMEASSPLSDIVTNYSNNQNGVKPRDFKSNHPIQIRLQTELKKEFKKEFFYEIKRGENNHGLATITNEQAGLYLMAFDLKRPWATHRKYQIFEDDYRELFGRPAVTAKRIVLCHLLCGLAENAIPKLNNSLFAKYTLTKYLILYIIRLIMDEDDLGKKVTADPDNYVVHKKSRKALLQAIKRVLDDVVVDLNAEIDSLGEDFDYRGKLRDEKWVTDLTRDIVSNHRKLVGRGRISSLAAEYAKFLRGKPKRK